MEEEHSRDWVVDNMLLVVDVDVGDEVVEVEPQTSLEVRGIDDDAVVSELEEDYCYCYFHKILEEEQIIVVVVVVPHDLSDHYYYYAIGFYFEYVHQHLFFRPHATLIELKCPWRCVQNHIDPSCPDARGGTVDRR